MIKCRSPLRFSLEGLLVSGVALFTGCESDVEEPDQVGEYVEIFNESGEELCPGTAAQMDDFLEHAFAVLGETPPGSRFVEYHWGEDSLFGVTKPPHSGGVRVESGSAVHEHELVHAAQFATWPRGPDFLEEGLAVMLSESVINQVAAQHPTGRELDEALVLGTGSFDYDVAWLVVSQIVLEHGLSGLKEFWFALPGDVPMEQVRETYTQMFGTSFDDLTQPFEAVVFDEPQLLERGVCRIRFCTGERLEWTSNETVEGTVPTSCMDEHAVSPSSTIGERFPWRDYVVEGPSPAVGRGTAPGVYVDIQPCGVLWCNDFTVRNAGLVDPPDEPWLRENTYRLRVSIYPDEFDPDSSPTFQLVPR